MAKKGKQCSICADKNRYQIDVDYSRSKDIRGTSRKHKVSEDALGRHIKHGHITGLIIEAQEKEDRRVGLQLLSLLEDTVRDLRDLADDARTHSDYRAAAAALGHVLRAAEILTKTPDANNDPKESGFVRTYTTRAAEVFNEAQSPKNQ